MLTCPCQSKAVADSKLSSFQAGQHRKSKRDKEREAAEAKEREEEDANARALAEYMDTFEGEGVGNRQKSAGFVAAGTSSTYNSTSSSSRAVEPPRGPRFRVRTIEFLRVSVI